MSDTKSLGHISIKDADKGEITAVFSRLDVIDKDGDVTLRGAFEDGAAVAISAYGHQSWKGVLPVGRGRIRELATEAVLEGRFFMDTQHGRDTFVTVKEMGELQEWSYSLRDVKARMGDFEGQRVRFLERIKVHEVSPVLVGAGVNTHTVSAKSQGSFAEHCSTVLEDLDDLVDRAKAIKALRATKGGAIGESATVALGAIRDRLRILSTVITTDDDEAMDLYLRSMKAIHDAQTAVREIQS